MAAPVCVSSSSPPHRIYGVYNSVGYNCFIAAGVYVLLGAFCCCQMRLNKRKASGTVTETM